MFGDSRLPDLFWQKVRVANSGCWEWVAYCDKDGYGKYSLASVSSVCGRGVHRITYHHFIARIPEGMQIDHLCRNRRCCNPEHLEAVTVGENVNRSLNYIALNRRKTHCPQGHAYVGDNLVIKINRHGTESRVCKKCRNDQAREYQRHRRAAAKAKGM